MDDTGELVMSPDFIVISDIERSKYEGVSLAIKEGYIFSELLKQGVFLRQSRIDYQGVCKHSITIPSVSMTPLLDFKIKYVLYGRKKDTDTKWVINSVYT